MKIESRPFGEIEIDEKKIITIKGGMFGFEGNERYALIGVDEQKPFQWLQCVDDPTIAFVVLEPESFMPTYVLKINAGDKAALGITSESELLTYIVAVIPDDMKKITVNLKGPVLVNPKTYTGKQVISDVDEYTVRHALFHPEASGQASGTTGGGD